MGLLHRYYKVSSHVSCLVLKLLFSMRYVAAYALAALGGATPSAKDIEKILSSVGVDCDADLAGKVVSELSGKDLAAVIAEGMERLVLCLLVVAVELLLLLQPVMPQQLLKQRRKRNLRKNLMMTWASVSSTKHYQPLQGENKLIL